MKKFKHSLFFIIVFLSGFTTLVYEITFTRKVSLIFGSTIHSMSTVLSSFLIGFSIGALIFNKFFNNKKSDKFLILFFCQIIVFLFSVVFLISLDLLYELFYFLYSFFDNSFYLFMIFKSLFLVLLIGIPTTCFGLFFITACNIPIKAKKENTLLGNVYSISNFGSVLGAWSIGFVFIPLLGLNNSIIFAASINLLLALLLIYLRKWRKEYLNLI